MKSSEATVVLGLSPFSPLTLSPIKAAYKTKVWDVHPDRFPPSQRPLAESRFKLISEAYSCLLSSTGNSSSGPYTRVVRTGVARANGGGRRNHHPLVGIPFLLIILGTVGLGSLTVARAYRKAKQSNPSHNPFRP